MVYSRIVNSLVKTCLVALPLLALTSCIGVSPDKQAAHNEKQIHLGANAEDFAFVPFETEGLDKQQVKEMEMLFAGFTDGAPEFTLECTSGESITLSEEVEQQPVLLFFYPADFAPNATRELRLLAEMQTEVGVDKVRIFGVSGKLIPGYSSLAAQQREFVDEQQLGLPLLADLKLATAIEYGCAPIGGEYPQRTVIIIGQGREVLAYSRLQLTADQIKEILSFSNAKPAS